MAGIVAGSIAGGWSPIERREGDTDSLRFGRDRSKSDLSKEYRLDTHPETLKKDALVVSEAPDDSQHPPSQQNDITPLFPAGPLSGEPSPSSQKIDTTKDDTAP